MSHQAQSVCEAVQRLGRRDPTLRSIYLYENQLYNQLGSATYLALAAALRVNSSLRDLYLNNNQAVDQTRIEAAFVEALRLNSNRSVESDWQLYSCHWSDVDFERLRDAASELGHPSLQLLAARLLTDDQLAATQQL